MQAQNLKKQSHIIIYPSRMKLNTVGQLVITGASDTLAGLRVPQFDVTVITGADKIGTIVIEADIFHSLAMSYQYGKRLTDEALLCC